VIRLDVKRWTSLALVLAAIVLFFIANRGAYKGYFSDDDLANLTWPTYVHSDVYLNGLLTPRYYISNFRPVGDLYYRFLYRAFHLNFPPYVAALQCLHLLNATLLFFLLRRLGFSEIASGAGAIFYVFHVAVLEAYWKPMYVFDVLCAALCLVTLLMYFRGHWILALVPFWLAYKSKEIAIMLPAALLAYELLLGERKWKRLFPYFIIALNFGLQALWTNRHLPRGHNYLLLFTPHSLWNSIVFYSSAILFLPYAGLLVLFVPILLRDRRLYLGLIFIAASLVPLLALPRRADPVYWYVPLIGLAVVVAAIASRMPAWAIAGFFAVWLPLNYAILREKRREILAVADESRWYTTSLIDYARRAPPLRAAVYDSIPEHVHQWGIEGAIHVAFGPQVNAVWYHDPKAAEAMAEVPMALLSYYPVEHTVRGLLRTTNSPEGLSYMRFNDGWFNGQAELSLYRPKSANAFEVVARLPRATVTLFENGHSLGARTLPEPDNPEPLRWKLDSGTPGVTYITIRSEPSLHVYALGYVSP
jgi:hypothetical protein